MPNLDGFALTKKIRQDSRLAHLPVIALISSAKEADMAKAREAGINDYQFKMDKKELPESIYKYLKERT